MPNVGLLESPYKDLRQQWMTQLLALILVISVFSVGITIYIVKRITAPLEELGTAAKGMTQGRHDVKLSSRNTYAEIASLTEAFQGMQRAIAERDQHLRQQNTELAETNDKLARVNRNYMESLGFVTHELKSPLAAMQSLIDVVAQGYAGPIPDKASSFLSRVRRSCLEMQEMVKNYLDLSRAERGELMPHRTEVELITDVVRPAVDQTRALFDLRNISLSVECPDQVEIVADPEMLRIALVNLLSNASKYGREGGSAGVSVTRHDELVDITVRNDGKGFTLAEQETLFRKFSRLKNDSTRGQRGSGLGLFLCLRIAESHGGRVWAESEPGQWAEFCISIPDPK
jgi:signal transduction histidine kinase